jgi:phosphoglycolate phosphatase-like HAD superfamily hydrolase
VDGEWTCRVTRRGSARPWGRRGQEHRVNLLFDLDGTLTDPFVGITRCIQHALSELGRAAPPSAELSRFIGPPLRGTFAELLSTKDDAAISERLQSTGSGLRR